jgi:hypothetical protein
MNTVQRAFELAASGNFQTFQHLKWRMHREKLENVDAHLAGGTIKRQLNLAIQRAMKDGAL